MTPHRHSLLVLLVLAASACDIDSDSVFPIAEPTDEAMLLPDAAVEMFHGLYSIPVDDPALKPFATVAIYNIRRVAADGQIELTYPIPAVLTGLRQDVVLTGSSAGNELSGPAGQSSCISHETRVECDMLLGGLEFDQEGLRVGLQQIGLLPDEIEARLRVAELFQADPIGVLTIEKTNLP